MSSASSLSSGRAATEVDHRGGADPAFGHAIDGCRLVLAARSAEALYEVVAECFEAGAAAATASGHPSERQIGLTNWPLLAGYRLLPRVFGVLVGPLMRAGSFSRQPLSPTSGNVSKPREALHEIPTLS